MKTLKNTKLGLTKTTVIKLEGNNKNILGGNLGGDDAHPCSCGGGRCCSCSCKTACY